MRRECETEPHLEEILDGHQKPIILLPKKEGGTLCESVAPDNPKIGVMLPYAPVQLLLFDYQDETKVSDCLVMTSANTSGAPICRDDEDALNAVSYTHPEPTRQAEISYAVFCLKKKKKKKTEKSI